MHFDIAGKTHSADRMKHFYHILEGIVARGTRPGAAARRDDRGSAKNIE